MIKSIFSIIFIVLGFQTWAQENKTKNLIIVTLDGLRWQEIFEGADPKILSKDKFVNDRTVIERFKNPSGIVRREKLMPFLWQTVGIKGQIYGNRRFKNLVDCSNPHWFSYPGYSEMLVGFVDRRVRSNNPVKNPSQTVLDFIQSQSGFENKVATFATWDLIGSMVGKKDEAFQVNTGNELADGNISAGENLLNELQELLPAPYGARYDAFTFYYAFEYLKRSCPRVMFISLEETDQHAHGGRYDEYLKAAHRTDKMIGKLWDWIQTQEDYKDQTTLILTTDHGRGSGSNSWKRHGRLAFDSSQIWFAVIGPDTPASGEVKIQSQYYQKQIAKTAAALLGFEYVNVEPVGSVIKSMIVLHAQPKGDDIIAYELDFLRRIGQQAKR